MKRHFSKGFTLIELLVVIAIIGILSTVVMANLGTARQKSRDAKRVSDLKQMQLALELYADQNGGVYPTTLPPLAPNYISNLPKDPNGDSYFYSAIGSGASCTGYHLGAVLEINNTSLLNGDSDAAARTACTGSAADFDGTSAACTTTTGADMCYDTTN